METINRAKLKENAKVALKRNFWMIMLVIFVGGILHAGWTGLGSDIGYSSGASSVNRQISKEMSKRQLKDDYGEEFLTKDVIEDAFSEASGQLGLSNEELAIQIVIVLVVIVVAGILISIVISVIQFAIGVFVFAPIGVGYRQFFMKNRHENAKFDNLFTAFKQNKYMKIVKSMFLTNIRIWGWSMLFYFPGLVKYYQYYFVPYIMAENSDISPERARKISSAMTHGHKWQMFVLNLSFIGWRLLSALIYLIVTVCSCFILAVPGVVLMYPVTGYEETTFAELYAERREYALSIGIASASELIGFEEVKEDIL